MSMRTRKFRADSKLVDLYNDGRLVFVYDEDNVPEIVERVPSADDVLDESSLEDAARRALILVYEVPPHAPGRIELSVGGKITKPEQRGVEFLPPQRGFLRAPSGRLRLETSNSLALRPNETTDRGGRLRVEQGRWRIHLHRPDLAQISDADFEAYRGPGEVLAFEACRAIPKTANFLPYEGGPAVGETAIEPFSSAPPKGRVVDGTYEGHVRFDAERELVIDIDEESAKVLRLKSGDRLRLVVGELDLLIDVMLDDRTYFDMTKAELRAHGPELATALWSPEGLALSRDHKRRRIKKSERDRWIPATLRKW